MTTTKNRTSIEPSAARRWSRSLAPATGILLLAAAGWMFVEVAPMFAPAVDQHDAVFGYDVAANATGEGDFLFFTFRRTLWVFQRSKMSVTFYGFPDGGERDTDMQISRTYSIDSKNFPIEQLRFQQSERNLSNYLWLLNPHTGKAMSLKARRDGIIEESELLDLSKKS